MFSEEQHGRCNRETSALGARILPPFESKPAQVLYSASKLPMANYTCQGTACLGGRWVLHSPPSSVLARRPPVLLASWVLVTPCPGLFLAMRMSWSWRWMTHCW